MKLVGAFGERKEGKKEEESESSPEVPMPGGGLGWHVGRWREEEELWWGFVSVLVLLWLLVLFLVRMLRCISGVENWKLDSRDQKLLGVKICNMFYKNIMFDYSVY